MPFIKISGLTTATAVSATNQFEINQNGASRSANLAQLATYTRGTATDIIVLAAGSAGAPAIVPTGDSNTGIFFPAADTIAFSEGGTEVMRLDSNGDVGIGTTSPTARLNVVDATSQDAVRITQTGAGNALVIEDATNPDATPFVVDASGQVIRGHSSTIVTVNYAGSTATPAFQNIATGTPGASFGTFLYNASSSQSPQFLFSRSASGTIGTPGAVAVNNLLGAIGFAGDDGTEFVVAANITAAVDGTPGAGDMPGRLLFSTTADGASAATERMRITSAGNVGIGTSAPVNRLQVNGSFGRGAPVTKTGNFTLADTENWLICNGAGTITVTFPAASSWTGREVMIKTIAAQTVVSASSNVVPLAGGAAGTAILAASAGAWATLVSDGTNWVIMQA